MILKAFKEKSNQKYVNSILRSRNVGIGNKKIESLGVILNINEFNDFEVFRLLAKDLGILPNKIKIIALIEDEKKSEKLWNSYFSPKDIGWHGKIKNIDLQMFLDTEFDALICYYEHITPELELVSVVSKANFKIGISNVNKNLYDFIIETSITQFSLFKTELIKYLTVLNKL